MERELAYPIRGFRHRRTEVQKLFDVPREIPIGRRAEDSFPAVREVREAGRDWGIALSDRRSG